MTTAAHALTNSPADIIKWRQDLMRTGQCLPLGRATMISIAPSSDWDMPADADPFIKKFGRLIDLRPSRDTTKGIFLPLAQSVDRSQLLVTAPLLNRDGRVGLPDVPDPDWKPATWTADEISLKSKRDPAKDSPRMLPQRLEDRTRVKLEGTNFLVFQPVISVIFQPEIDKQMEGRLWKIDFLPDAGGTHAAFMVDQRTGECHFFGGRFLIASAHGEK